MSRWDEIKKRNNDTTSEEDDSNLSRWDKIKKKSSSTPSDRSDIQSFLDDSQRYAESGEGDASELSKRYTELSVKYNLNRPQLSEDESKLKSSLYKAKTNIIRADNSRKGVGAEGWQKYLDDQSKAKEDEPSIWEETIIRGFTTASDNPFNQVYNNVVYDYRNDDSYKRPNDDWSEAQKNMFGSLYLQSPEKAFAYAEKINNENNKAKEEAEIKNIQNSATSNGWAGAAHTAGAIGAAPFGLADYLNMLAKTAAGRDASESDGIVSPFEYSQAVTEGIATDLNEKSGTINETLNKWTGRDDIDLYMVGDKGLGDLYSLGVSIAQSWASGKLLGSTGTLISYFGQGATSGMKDALERGAEDWQAALYGTSVGLIEGILESLAIDKLFGEQSASTLKGFIKATLAQAGTEGAEEGLTTFFSTMVDDFVMQDKSTMNQMVLQYIALGMSEEDAKKQAAKDIWEGLFYDTLAGAISGGVHGGAEMSINTWRQNAYAKQNYGDLVEDLLIEAGQTQREEGKTSDVVDKYIDKYGEKGKLSGWNIAHLLEITDTNKIKTTAESRLTQLGEKGNISQLADILTKQVKGIELSKAEQKLLSESTYGQRVANELNPKNIRSGQYATNWSEQIGTRTINPYEYNKGKNIFGENFSNKLITKGVPDDDEAKESKYKSSESGKTILNDEEVSIQGIESIEGGEVTVRLENGDVVNASDIEFGSQHEALMYDIVARMDATPETANSIFNTIKPVSTAQASMYYTSVPLAYEYGKINHEAGLKNINLPKSVKNAIFTRGRIDAMIQAEKNMPKTDSAKKGSVKTNKKGIIYEGGYKYHEASASPLQKSSMEVIEAINAISNLEIHVYESKLKNGKRVAYVNGKAVYANGYFRDGNKIYIDINAGQHGEGLMLDTLGHEVTHYIRENNAKGFKAIGDFLIEQYGKNGVNVQERLDKQKQKIIDRYKRNNEALPSEAKLNDMAYEELVADAMSEMFNDPKAVEKLSKLKQENRNAWETLRDAIKKILDKIKSILDQYKSEKRKVAKDAVAVEAARVRDFSADAYEKLQDLYIKAFVEADANYAAAEQTLSENGIMVDPSTESASIYSVRDVLDDDKRQNVAKALATRFNVTQKEALQWLTAETSLASLILNPKYSQYLDYTPDPNEVAIKTNSDYPQGTVDFSPICAKRREFTAVMNNILRLFKNHVFAATDLAKIRSIMQEEGMTIPCGICYVEDRRQLDTIVAQNFIDSLKLYREGSKTRPDGKAFNANQLKGLKLIDGDSYTPTVYELVSLEGLNVLKEKNPSMAEAWIKFNNARGMQSVRLLANEAEYKRQILKYGKQTVKAKNDKGGLRIYSFSDAEMFHLIDIIQVITDSATVGLSLQGYTKVNEYAKAVKDTGEKLNRSLIPKGELGYHIENGEVILDYDTVEGIDINHPDFFDNRDNPNVGNITIGVSDTQIRAAMVSDFVDQIIPFHTGQSEDVLGEKGIATWSNYKDFQTEKDIATGKVSDHQINIYTEVLQPLEKEGNPITKRTFVEKFLQVCKENNLTPRFSQFLNTNENGDFIYNEGYHKMLVDFKTFAQTETGEYLPQLPVKPIFDNEYITKILKDYVKSQEIKDAELAKSMPKVIERITNEIVKQSETTSDPDIRYSFRDSESGMANDALSPYNEELTRFIEQRGDYIVDSFEKLEQIVNLAFDNPNLKATAYFGIVNIDALEKIKNSIPNLPQASKDILFKEGKDYSIATTFDAIRHIVDDKNLSREDVINYLDRLADTILEFDSVAFNYYIRKNNKFPGLLFKKSFDDGVLISFDLVSHKKRSLVLQTLYMDSADYQKKKVAKTLLMQNASSETSETQVGQPSGNSIPQNTDSVKREFSEDIRYSDREIQPITEEEYQTLEKHFGVTGNFRVAGYLLPNGKLLDFSGKHWGGTTSRSRQVDHRDVNEVLDRGNNGYSSMVDMIGSGNIRLMPETGGINLAVYPNEKQRRVLSIYIKQMLATEGQVIVDYDAVGGDTVYSRVYEKYASSEQILRDIRNYFNGARQSDLMQFHTMYSDRDFPSNAEDIAKEYFGITTKWAETGWLLKDGTQLDFSGRHWERYPELEIELGEAYYRGKRNVEHFEIVEAFPELRDFSGMKYRGDNLNGFLQRGNIRIVGNHGIDLLTMPTDEQFEKLRSYFRENTDKYIVIGIGTNSLNFREGTNASIKIEAIRDYFLKGKDRRSDLMRFHNEYYSDRDTETISNRTLLANALDTVAQNDIEKTKLAQYREKIALIESEQAKLSKIRAEIKELSFAKGPRDTARIKSLQFEANQAANRINTYDRQLLNLESTKALKGVLDREKAMARKKAEQMGKESLRRQKEKDAATVRELLARNYESRKKATESRNKTAMRHKIRKVVNELNQLLLHGSKERNVKLGLQEAVAAALDAINMDTVGADERVAKYNTLIAQAKDPDVIASLKETRDRIKAQGDSLGDKLKAMKEAYYGIQHGEESKNYPAYFKEEATLIEQRIQNVIDKVGNTSLRDMSLTQLDLVYDMYKMVLTTIRNANAVWKEGKALDLKDNASAVMTELEEIKELGEEGTKIGEYIRSYSWNEMTPYYAFDRIGSKTLKSFFMEAIRGQNVYANDVAEAKAFADKIRKKYGYTKWDLDKVYEFKLKDGRTFQVTLKHMLSIYAYSKREQALPHMSTGGFFFNDKSTFRKKGGIIELIRRTDSGYKIDAETLAEIKEALGNKVNYVDEMQEYLTKMGEKGNEVTRTLWGIDLFKEKVYFPLKSMSDFIKKSTETAQSVSLKNDGMTKETVPGASNPIVLEAFDDVWASHIDRMSQYHAFVIPIDNLNKIHQYGTWAGTESMAVSTMLTGRFGSAVNEYISQFIKDLNGNVVNPGAKNPLMGFLTKFKKTAVGASLSTMVQQPTAVLRAMADVNAKYFIGKPNTSKLSNQWEELKQYAPIAIIKDIGGFDAGSGVQVSRWLNTDTLRGVDKVMNTIDDFSMKGAELFDQLGWTSIWEAVKREISATTNLKAGSEEFLKKAGERFTEVIVRTQVYDSTLSRSGYMRSKSDTMKMLTAFMGEPTLSMNMMFNAIINAKRGGSKKQAVRTIGFTYASIIAASAMASLIYALRDDDDDESYLEKYMQSLGSEFISDVVLAPVTSLPAVKDIASIFQGWDVERTDVAIFKDIKDAFDGLSSEAKSPYRKIEDFAGAIAAAFGIPLKNVLRTGREIYNAFSAITDDISGGDAGGAFIEGITGKGQSKPSQLYNAIINGDDARLERIKSSYKDESSYLNAVKSALRANDSRIHEAAQARLDGNISEYTRIAREIIAEGHFSQDIVVAAINSEMNAIKKGESTQTESTDTKDEATSIYRADDINIAFDNGDTDLALSIIDELVEMKMANGMDEKKAKSSIRSSMTSYWKPLYKQAYASGNTSEMQRIKQILYKSGLYGSASEVIKDVNSWLKN